MTEHSSRVSIVLPTYNGEQHLARAIGSCLRQTHRNIELVVVDDCSTDRTNQIVRSFDDPRLVYVRNERNQGLPRALNIGFAKTTGEFLTWTSDDNEYAPTAIEEMLGLLRKSPGIDFVYADYTAHFESAQKTELRQLPDEPQLRRTNTVGACFLYTRRVYQEIGDFDVRLSLVEDYDYWIRVWKRFGMRHLPKDLYLYRYHSNSLTATRSRQILVLGSVLMYKHGFVSFAALTDSFYNLAARTFVDFPAKDAVAIVADSFARVRRVSGALAINLAFVLPGVWVVRKLRKLAAAVR